MPVAVDPRIGTELAGYRLERVLGRGGMGVVYLAEDVRLRRKVALKLIAPELAIEPGFRERFLRESELAASLDHSHVVPIYAAGETGGQLWIAMRYVEGDDLAALLEREGPLDPARAIELCSQVASALDAAHASGLVHRDVKPANVLVTREDGQEHCYLTDFGLARDAEADSDAHTHLSGTVDYTAPEQIAHEPADAHADAYSLGCVLYESFAGEPPFRRSRPMATLFAHASEQPPSLHERRPELPEAIDGVIARALAKNPDDRYGSCGELCDAARETLGLENGRRPRWMLVVAAAGLALAIAAAAALPAILLGGGRPATLSLAVDSLVRIDPADGVVADAMEANSVTGPLAVGEGSVWLGDPDRKVIARIDPRSGTVTEEIDVAAAGSPWFIAAGEGALWISSRNATDLFKHDLVSGRLERIDTGLIYPTDLAIADGSVWTACCTGVLRIDAQTGRIEADIQRESEGGNLVAADANAVWVGGAAGSMSEPTGIIQRLDPDSNSVVATIDVDDVIVDIATGDGALWFVTLTDDRVSRVDPATNEVSEAFNVGRIPEALVVGGGAVWVASGRDETVTRFDLTTLDLRHIDVGGRPTALASGEDGIWVAVDVA